MAFPHIRVGNIADAKKTNQFISTLELTTPIYISESAETGWRSLSTTIHNSAVAASGKKEGTNAELYEANLTAVENITFVHYKDLDSPHAFRA